MIQGKATVIRYDTVDQLQTPVAVPVPGELAARILVEEAAPAFDVVDEDADAVDAQIGHPFAFPEREGDVAVSAVSVRVVG